MDTKLSEAFATLKNLFANRDSGKIWDGAVKARPPVPAGDGWQAGADEVTIVAVAEETAIAALGLSGQYRFKRRDSFACGGHLITAPHQLGQMALDGRQYYLGQILVANRRQSLLGHRALLALGDHVGRKVKVSWKLHDGYHQSGATYQVAHTAKKPYTIIRHGAGWLEVDDWLEPYATGYLFFEFT